MRRSAPLDGWYRPGLDRVQVDLCFTELVSQLPSGIPDQEQLTAPDQLCPASGQHVMTLL